MHQRGQVLPLNSTGAGGRPLWAYRLRLDGRDSPRVQRGGFRSRQAHRALRTPTLTELNAREIAAWRMTIPEGHRFEATQALRQLLARAGL